MKKSLLSLLLTAMLTVALTVSGAAADYIVSFTPTDPGATPESELSAPDLDPIIIKLGDDDLMKSQSAAFYRHGDNLTEGIFAPVTEDGISCIRLDYAEPTEPKLPEYRFMIKLPKHPDLTEHHKYIRVTFKTDEKYTSNLVMLNNGDRAIIKMLFPDSSVSNGEWVRTNAVSIEENGCLSRFLGNMHATIGFYSGLDSSAYFVSEIGLFTSPDAAYEHYGDSPRADGVELTAMTFGDGGTATTLNGDTYGVHAFNDDTQSLDITYAAKTNAGVSYMAKLKWKKAGDYSSDQRYMRVLYSAENPEGITGASMYLRTDARANVFLIKENIENTNGKFVLSDTVQISKYAADRFSGTGELTSLSHNSLIINTTKPGGKYSIKAVYFFSSKKEADAFTYDDCERKVTINGVPIEKYRIVISENPATDALTAAKAINMRINTLTGFSLDIVDDNTDETAYEILIGKSNRKASLVESYPDKIDITAENKYLILTDGTKLIITAKQAIPLELASNTFLNSYLYAMHPNPPENIDISGVHIAAVSGSLKKHGYFSLYDNVEDPVRFTEDFSSDRGYFSEVNYIDEDPTDHFYYDNGVYSVESTDSEIAFLQVYEPDVTFKAKMKYAEAYDNGELGLMLRFNSREAFVKAGYDFERGEWFIDSRQGRDFYHERIASVKADIEKDRWYELIFTADGYSASLSVDGSVILTSDKASHHSPGRIAFFAADVEASFDDADITLLSGEGTIMKNVSHTLLWDETGLAGGSVIDMLDGTRRFIYSDSVNLISYDGGLTWESTTKLTSTYGQPNIIRLNSGELLLCGKGGSDVFSMISSDDGKTWTRNGYIAETPYGGDKEINAVAVNMNDKVFQSPTTDRIFFCQNYEAINGMYEGRKVFCEFYYSDDKGATWTKSETDSWQIEGNESETHFGECKLLECSDGSIRMYTSWNMYGCIVYSESIDGGKTFGPLVLIPELDCSLSSMQFARDPYAENDHTYYMVYVKSVRKITSSMPRSRLMLAKSEDGKTWTDIGDIWRWECDYNASSGSAVINHIVNPFIYVNEDYIFCGSGTSEHMDAGRANYHQQQRQNIYTIRKDTLGTELVESELYSKEQYGALEDGTYLALIKGDKAVTYSCEGTDFMYSPLHGAHLAILTGSPKNASGKIEVKVTNTPAKKLAGNGDVNGDGYVTAGDAALISAMLHAPSSVHYTDKMRLEADVFVAGAKPSVTVLDAAKVLNLAVGL